MTVYLNVIFWWSLYCRLPVTTQSLAHFVFSLTCFECSLRTVWLILPQSLSFSSSHFWLVMFLAEMPLSWFPVCWILRVMHRTSCFFLTLPFKGPLLSVYRNATQLGSHCTFCKRILFFTGVKETGNLTSYQVRSYYLGLLVCWRCLSCINVLLVMHKCS